MATEARTLGVDIVTDAPVACVLTRDGHASGVVLADGRELSARVVVGNLHPQTLYLGLVDADALDAADPDFRARMGRWQSGSGSFRMNVALSELPDFSSAPGTHAQPHHGSGIIMAPSLAYMERAWLDAKRDGMSREPIVEVLIPSTLDDSLAPPRQHVASLFCQQFNPVLPDGRSWDERRDEAADLIIDTVTR